MNKALAIFLNSLPVIVMIGLIPFIKNDYLLTGIFIAISVIAFLIHIEKKDLLIYLFGFCIMIASEYLFISTGVETFVRDSLFGLMPLWLPFLWGYGFVAIKRSSRILEK